MTMTLTMSKVRTHAEPLPIVYAFAGRYDMTPARQQYLMNAMAAHTKVFFLNMPRITGRRFERLRPTTERITESLTVVHDAFGFRLSRGSRHIRKIASAIDGRWLRRVLHEQGVRDYVLWLSAALPEVLPGLSTSRFVYDCIDPCFVQGEEERVLAKESALARKATLVFASAESLVENLKPVNPNTHLLMNACAFDEYKPGSGSGASLPAQLSGRPRPCIGYMGTVDWRLDVETLVAAARALPNATFAIVGRINADQETRIAELRKLPNVLITGAVSAEEGHRFVAAFDIGLVPFLGGAMGDGVNPVKMWMYLAAGKPVVTTWMRECRRYAPYVRAARDPQEFAQFLRDELAGNDAAARTARLAFAQQHTWEKRAEEAVGHFRRSKLWQ